jgi:hypothetical protein
VARTVPCDRFAAACPKGSPFLVLIKSDDRLSAETTLLICDTIPGTTAMPIASAHASGKAAGRSGLSLACGALVALAASRGASAHPFCVADSAQLQHALTAASDGGRYVDEDNVVRIVAGHYPTGAATGNKPFLFEATHSTGGLVLEGSYGAGCAGERRPATDTVIDGAHATGAMVLRNANGPISVTHLTFQNGESAEPGAGLQVNYLTAVEAPVRIDHVIIRNNHTTASAGGLYASGSNGATPKAVRIASSLIHDNLADVDAGGAYVTGYGDFAEVIDTTIARNQASGGGATGGIRCGGSAKCGIYESIVWSNTNIGITLDGAGAIVCDDYALLGGTRPGYLADNLSVPPLFIDAAGGNFHLSAGSPLFGACPGGGGGTDLDDQHYGEGRKDPGAFGDTAFIDGLDDWES